jgi:hypothetical protein
MPQYRGKIQSLSVSQDGQEVSLAADIMGGERLRLVFPANDLDRLLAVVAHAATLAMQRRLDDASVRKLLPVNEWQVRPHSEGGVIITLCMRADIRLSFALDHGAATQFSEAIFQTSTAPRLCSSAEERPN